MTQGEELSDLYKTISLSTQSESIKYIVLHIVLIAISFKRVCWLLKYHNTFCIDFKCSDKTYHLKNKTRTKMASSASTSSGRIVEITIMLALRDLGLGSMVWKSCAARQNVNFNSCFCHSATTWIYFTWNLQIQMISKQLYCFP